MSTRTVRLAAPIVFLSLGACSPGATEPQTRTAALSGQGITSTWNQYLNRAIAIGSGSLRSCAVFNGGRVECWGWAPLGDGTLSDSTVPVVSVPSNAAAVSPGGAHICALLETGSVLCWGSGFWGQLGNGQQLVDPVLSPVGVIGLTDAVAITSGSKHSCARRSNGTVVCWGGDNNHYTSPQPVSSLTNVVSVEAGMFDTCAVAGGTVHCWGNGPLTPVQVSGISNAASVTLGATFACARRTTGDVMCWGSADYALGQVGVTSSAVPITVSGLTDATAVAAGDKHVCALRSNHHVVCWGEANHGQLGNGETINGDGVPSAVPVEVSGLTDAVAVSAGGDASCALRSNGGVVCWGRDMPDGPPVAIDSDAPMAIAGTGAAQIPVGTNVSVTLTGVTGAESVTLTFAQVTAPGTAQADVVTTPGPGDLTVMTTDGALDTWDVDITATFTGVSTVCFDFPTGIVAGRDPTLVALMRNGLDITTSIDPVNLTICGDLNKVTGDLGDRCTVNAACGSNLCADGVCCSSACAACEVCSVDAGGTSNGTCTTVTTKPKICRTAGGPCDVDDFCDGVSPTCPTDVLKVGTVCEAPPPSFCDWQPPVCGSAGPLCPAHASWGQCTNSSTATNGKLDLLGGLGAEGGVQLTFNSPDGAPSGEVAASLSSNPSCELNAGLTSGTGQFWTIEKSSTATNILPLTVCVHYDPDLLWTDECNLTFYQGTETGPGSCSWTNIGSKAQICTSDKKDCGPVPADCENANTICGSVTAHLSPFFVGAPPRDAVPHVVVPADIVAYATSAAGAAVTFAASASDPQDGPLTPTCTPAAGSTFPFGKTTVTCTATDSSAILARASFVVWVQVQAPADGTFFLPPINPDGSSVFKQGSTVPVKFKLTGVSAALGDLTARLSVAKVAASVTGTDLEATSNGAANDGDLFRYDAATRQYVFNLATKPLSGGSWSLQADLGDGVAHQVKVSLRK